MAAPDRRRRPRFTIVVMVLLSITVLTLDSKNVPVLGSVRSGLARVLSPIESGLHSATTPFRNAWHGIGGYGDLKDENTRLRQQLDELKGQRLENQDAAAQVQKLKELTGIPFIGPIPTQAAEISTGNFSTFDDNSAQIDKGSNSGLKVGMPVVTNAGLVGRIQRVTPTSSFVQLVTDPDQQLGIRLSSNTFGLGHGSGSGRPYIVTGIPLAATVKVGDPITTSGDARAIMPPNLPIGTVTKVTRNQSDQTQLLEVRLAADLSRLDYVQVLVWEPTP